MNDMGIYCYRNGDSVIERYFPTHGNKPKTIRHNGRNYHRSFADEGKSIPQTMGWPLECVASGVHPSQANELREFYKKAGVPTDVTSDGNPVYRDATHRKKALKARGFSDRSAYL
jgi:hypothetical protein